MAHGCKEQFDLEFLHFVLTFNSKNRKRVIQKLNLIKDKKKVLIFKTDKQVDKFLAQISGRQTHLTLVLVQIFQRFFKGIGTNLFTDF
jgi:hypothetical protein